MSEITITKDNISRFNKRLQKALKKQFNQEVPLHIAATLFANSLGVEGDYQLKQQLDIVPANINTTTANTYSHTIKAQALLDDINHYFSQGKSLLNSFVVYYIDSNVSLFINSESIKFPNTEQGFGLYFEDNPIKYLHDNLKKQVHSQEDLVFLDTICRKYFTDDYDENIYLGSRMIRLLGINPQQRGGQVDTVYLYKKNQDINKFTIV